MGDVVAYRSYHDNIQSAGQCDIVLELVSDVEKIEYEWSTGIPRFIRLMSCYVGQYHDTTPYNRLDSGKDITKISGDSFNRVIKPIYDQIQDRVSRVWKSLARSPEESNT